MEDKNIQTIQTEQEAQIENEALNENKVQGESDTPGEPENQSVQEAANEAAPAENESLSASEAQSANVDPDTTTDEVAQSENAPQGGNETQGITQLLFGVDTDAKMDIVLQNNLSLFDWVVRNKRYPDFVAKHLTGENALTNEEKDFIHRKGCMVAAICHIGKNVKKEDDGVKAAEDALAAAGQLEVKKGTALFFEIGEKDIKRDFLLGIAKTVIEAGYVPGFKANTDSKYAFDREFSRGMSTHKEVFEKCLVWAVAPILKEYNKITTTHLINPNVWKPFAPSCMRRNQVAIWQYGKNCHPICDDNDNEVSFNINLMRDTNVIVNNMF